MPLDKKYHLKKKKQYDAQKKAVVSLIKVMRGCSECGYRSHPQALQFDHLDPSNKEINVSCFGEVSWTRLLREIMKCRVLCANCHSVHTANCQDNNEPVTDVTEKTKNLINEILQCDLLTNNSIPAWQSFAIMMPTVNLLTTPCSAEKPSAILD